MGTRMRRGVGLVLKFSLLMIVLVIIIVAGVAVPLMLQMIPREQQMLTEALRNRARILLESVASRAADPVQKGSGGVADVSAFPSEISTMEGEALHLTISGPGSAERPGHPDTEDPLDRDYLWATNDPSLSETSFTAGYLPVSDDRLDHEKILLIARSVNAAAAATPEVSQVRTAAAADQREMSQAEAAAVQKALQEVAADEESGHAGTVPEFDPADPAGTYLFYRPLVADDPEGHYFTGMVRLAITTAKVREQVNAARDNMVRTSGYVAMIALTLGVVGAFVLASIAIRPIGRLVKAVSAIRQTEDKRNLQEIPVGARDEIGTLSETVNEMIEGLVTAAIAEEQMLLGRAIQKQFLPLEIAAGGEKGSTGGVKTAGIDLYAYYEGAAKVSGDYFDWQQLDDRYYAVMKCDVSGHGVEAAFIMVEVATLFLRWCREWKNRLAGPTGSRGTKEQERVRGELLRLDTLLYTINDMIEERGFRGKFAAFMLCLYDVRTGLVTACSAGDNKLYRFDAASGAMVTKDIKPGSPPVGPIPSDMIASGPARYAPVPMQLHPGDVLVQFTDGFEESKRHFRDAAGAPVACTDPTHLDKKQDPLSTHKSGDQNEEMSVPRIMGIFEAFFGRKTYRLHRFHAAQPEELEFDFSGCSDTLEEAVLALVAVERVYRTYRDPQTGPGDRIFIERKIDRYLRKHFKQYAEYFGEGDSADNASEITAISNIKEEVQEDDLTVVLLRRP